VKRKASVSHDEATIRELRKNPEFAAEYLRAALEDNDEPSVLLIALRRVAEARGGIAKVAKAAGIERESLYRALSVRGNPRLSTLVAVTKAVGLKPQSKLLNRKKSDEGRGNVLSVPGFPLQLQ
jgi:probable addiction module antidote protein